MEFDLKAAFGPAYSHIGVFISALAVFNWLVELFHFPLGPLLELVVYLFSPILDWLVDALLSIFRIELPPNWRNILTVYLVFGGATARTWGQYFRASHAESAKEAGTRKEAAPSFLPFFAIVLLGVWVWPLVVLSAMTKPIVARRGEIVRWWKGGAPLGTFDGDAREKMIREHRYFFDMRVVVLLQLVLVSLETAAMLSFNSVQHGGTLSAPFIAIIEGKPLVLGE